jgi:hypothetical protein
MAVSYLCCICLGAVFLITGTSELIAEWCLVVVGAATVGIIAWQSYATQEAAAATREAVELSINKDRARISLIEVRPLTIQMVAGAKHHEMWISHIFSIHAPTAAFNVSGFAGAILSRSREPNAKTDSAVRMKFPTSASETTSLNCVIKVAAEQVTDADLDELHNEVQFVRFFGVVKYKDTFGKDRETSWHLRWKGTKETGKPGTWEPIGPPEANRET